MIDVMPATPPPPRAWRALGQALPLIVFLVALAIGWEVIKLIGGQPIRVEDQVVWTPPFRFQFASDLNMPHLWDIVGALGRPATRNGPTLLLVLAQAALFTFRIALVGFLLGT